MLVEGYTDVIALHQAGVAEAVGSMGTALTDRAGRRARRLAPTVLLCLDADAAGQEAVPSRSQLLRRAGARSRRASSGSRRAATRPTWSSRTAPTRCARCSTRAVPVERFQVERVLERGELETPEGRDRVLRAVAPIIASLQPGLLQQDLVELVAGRLQMPESLVNQTLRGRTSPRAQRVPPRRTRRSTAPSPRPTATRRPSAPSSPAAWRSSPPAAPPLAEMDLDATFSSELTRRAAHYLAEHLDTPGQSLPAGADDLAKLVAGVVIDAGGMEADPEALTLERYTLEKLRLDRQISAARQSGEPVGALAAERQRVQNEIRRRLV